MALPTFQVNYEFSWSVARSKTTNAIDIYRHSKTLQSVRKQYDLVETPFEFSGLLLTLVGT